MAGLSTGRRVQRQGSGKEEGTGSVGELSLQCRRDTSESGATKTLLIVPETSTVALPQASI